MHRDWLLQPGTPQKGCSESRNVYPDLAHLVEGLVLDPLGQLGGALLLGLGAPAAAEEELVGAGDGAEVFAVTHGLLARGLLAESRQASPL